MAPNEQIRRLAGSPTLARAVFSALHILIFPHLTARSQVGLYKNITLHIMIRYNGSVNSEKSLQSVRCLQAPQGEMQRPRSMSTVQSPRLEMRVLSHRQAEEPRQERTYYL